MSGDPRPIGIFDSGIGGLTVLRAVADRLPAETLVYLGDTARVPYGTKSAATVTRYTLECAGFLRGLGIKALVVACNTASALAMNELRGWLAPLGLPALGVIEPGAVEACRVSRFGRVGVAGTSSTIRSGAYARAIGTIRPDFNVVSAACPLFVPLAEEGWTDPDDPVTLAAAARYLEPFAAARVDTLVLGCTHYPLLRGVIERVLPGVVLVDSGDAVARDLCRALERLGIAGDVTKDEGGTGGAEAGRAGAGRAEAGTAAPAPPPSRSSLRAQYHVTDDPERFREVGARFLGHSIEGPHLADLTPHQGEAAHALGERR
jgi:glutamate racemase